MLRLLTFFIVLLQITYSVAAQYDPADYFYPVEGAAHLFTGNFGEFRSNHFHSGVDIKTDEVVGKRVVASNNGYVSRISLSPTGFGLALYLAHPDGSTTVYAHLSKLRPDMETHLQNERYRTRQNSPTLYFTPTQFPVKRGELVAYSGNSGSSGGPHVHFEVRDGSQRPMNPVALGIIKPTDSIAPKIFNVYYIETETIDGVCYEKGVSKYPVVKSADGDYVLSGKDVMWVGREGYFVFEATDYRDGVSNIFGLYTVSASIDDKPLYNFVNECFSFAQTRYSNAISYYPLQGSTRTEYYRLKRLEAVPRGMIKYTDNNGVVTTHAGDERRVVIRVTDDVDNLSQLVFTIKGKDDKDCFKATPVPSEQIARVSTPSNFTIDSLKVSIPAGALYESTPFESSVEDVTVQLPSGIEAYSRCYSIFDYDTPLQRSVELSIAADIPAEKQKHVMMVWVSESGRTSAVTARYVDGRVVAENRSAGRYFVVVDDVKPSVTPSFGEGEVLSSFSEITFRITDNYSGVASYSATIDGEWIALDKHGSKLTHIFRGEGNGESHKLVITVSDGCKNSTTLTRTFIR